MSISVAYATGNLGKVKSAKAYLEPLGITVEQVTPSKVEEIQSTDVDRIAAHKAQQAYGELHRPLFVTDTQFGIQQFNGWPFCFNQQTVDNIRSAGYLRLMSPWHDRGDRSASYVDVVAYHDTHLSQPVVFKRRFNGRLALEERGTWDKSRMQSELWTIFIPDGHEKTMAEMGADEIAALRANPETGRHWAEFAAWLKLHTGLNEMRSRQSPLDRLWSVVRST